MESLKGKTAIITGAGKGIGRAIAIALINEGVHTGLIARTENDLKAIATIAKSAGVKSAYAIADVGDMKAVDAAVEKITTELGPIDILTVSYTHLRAHETL